MLSSMVSLVPTFEPFSQNLRQTSQSRSADVPGNHDYGMGCLHLRIRPILVSASSRKRSSGDRTTPLGM